ncbi:hypothetical protein KHM83_11300 [Fusibacter paucivorans]|uniref:DUF4015 domain-containing protein n=1 Tax=Fusibacter paucivorans TaxID=76009 RepID=A0ABS5PT90_9FIRM|nr:putative glycoside hydrolase [Fusibacter paucivorans]MBS7527267.1 hypothetical protein [Fusibacter paucivorans]
MKQSKKLLAIMGIAIVLVAFVIIGRQYNLFARSGNETAADEVTAMPSNDETESEKQARLEAERLEAERLEAERIEKERLEAERLEKIEKDIAENTWYIAKNDAAVYASVSEDASGDDPTVEGETTAAAEVPIATLSKRTEIYASDYIEDNEGNPKWVEIKSSYDALKPIGFVAYSDLVRSRADFITKPYEDADYTAFEKGGSYEDNPPQVVKGIYVTGPSASTARIDELIDLIDQTSLNTMVIDVKDDSGKLLFYTDAAGQYNPSANDSVYIKDIDSFVQKLKAHEIYLIARIVTFKSPVYAKANTDKAIVYKGGGLYSDADGLIWASAYNEDLWAYNVGVAKEAAAKGFDEIQFDYVRFPAISNKDRIDFRNETGATQVAAIQNYLKYAYGELSPMHVYVSADVFGWAATAINDVGIGQHWEAIANVVDYICPMMYPSHYGTNNFGLSVPDAQPYATVDASIKDALKRNENLETPAQIRPWIQDFTATWVKGHIRYGAAEVEAQIQALSDNGIDEFMLWNAGNRYSETAVKDE